MTGFKGRMSGVSLSPLSIFRDGVALSTGALFLSSINFRSLTLGQSLTRRRSDNAKLASQKDRERNSSKFQLALPFHRPNLSHFRCGMCVPALGQTHECRYIWTETRVHQKQSCRTFLRHPHSSSLLPPFPFLCWRIILRNGQNLPVRIDD